MLVWSVECGVWIEWMGFVLREEGEWSGGIDE